MKKTFLTILAFAFLLGIPVTRASILLSAEDFAILGGTAITSTGAVGTVISNGDVGLSPGATTGITGFPPAVIASGTIVATGPVTGQARADLIMVQTALALMPVTTILSNQDLGGMTLTSGVYKFDSAATLSGALILDGEGNDNAYWVFQIGDTLITTLNSTVTMINPGPAGGSDYGVFWNVGTSVTIGEGNAILGNYLAGVSITMGANADGSGRALALAGVTLDQNEIDAYGGPQGSDWTGGLTYDQLGNIVPIPEPSTALLSSFALVGFWFTRRTRPTR